MDGKAKAMSQGLSKKGGRGKLHVHSVHVRRASGGGFIASHEMKDKDGMGAGTQEHVIPDADALQDHMQATMGDQPPAGEGSASAPPDPSDEAPAEPGAGGM